MTKPDNVVVPAASRTTQAATHGSVSVADPHAEFRESLSDLLDDALSPTDRRRVEAHVRACQPCSTYLATLRATVNATQTLPDLKAPPQSRAKILERVRHEAARQAANGNVAPDEASSAADAS